MDKEWMELQNGSDIRGVAMEGKEGEAVNLTCEKVEAIAKAFAQWLSAKKDKKPWELRVSIGMDSRLTGPKIKGAAISGLLASGCSIYDFGMASTPAMFMSTVAEGYNYDGAIMITASHLPFNRNGIKFFTESGGLEKSNITEILSIASSGEFRKPPAPGNAESVDFISVYSDMLAKKIINEVEDKNDRLHPLKGFKIIVDAGNGAGGFFHDKVLKPLGANTDGSLYLEPDGNFKNHIPNPEDEEAMDCISSAVKESNADLGIIFDADVDRAGAVLKGGREVNRNRLIALMSSIVLEEHPGSTIVTDSVTSTGLKKFITNLGGKHHRYKRGYRNVINEALRLNSEGRESWLAMETSGHGALKENYFLDDGAYLVTKMIIKMAKLRQQGKDTLESLIAYLEEPAEAKEFRLSISLPDFREYGNGIIKDLEEYAKAMPGWELEEENYEGVRVTVTGDTSGWLLLRMSLHDPLLPLNIESDEVGGVKKIAIKLAKFLEKYEHIDISSIEKYIESH